MSSGPLPRTRRAPLRRRLVVVVVAAVAFIAATMGLLSTLALRGTLVSQLDTRLLASSERARSAPDNPAFQPPDDGSQPPGSLPSDTGGQPPGLTVLGQGAGTLSLLARGSSVVAAGYLDEDGTIRTLSAEQEAALLAVPADGAPHTVALEDLGSWRVVADQGGGGMQMVTGLAMSEVSSTVSSYLAAEAAVAVGGLAVVALAGAGMVRRELQPLERVAATAARVSEQPLERGEVVLERVPAADTDPATEVGQVGAALNRLLGSVEGALAARHESEMHVRQFVADASHELRTPLASIRGYAELVRRHPEGLPEDAVRAMERVESESRRMTALVEDLLLLARLDAGRALDRSEVDLAALALDAVTDAHVAGTDHVWTLDLGDGGSGIGGEPDGEADREAPEPVLVLGDDHRLRQVLVNLLANARVHTPAGTTVATSVRLEGDEAVLRVRDDGPGIAPDLLPRLFQRFTRGDAARSPGAGRSAEGGSTGLGLAIVSAVVAAHGGRIEVDGTPGATTFTVRLPAAGS